MLNANSELCFHCGWLGWCVTACPLVDPASSISPQMTTAPGLDAGLNEENFEIVLGEAQASPTLPPDAPSS